MCARRYQQLLAASSLVRLIDLNDTNKQVGLVADDTIFERNACMHASTNMRVDLKFVAIYKHMA